jgi:hypothetical protein
LQNCYLPRKKGTGTVPKVPVGFVLPVSPADCNSFGDLAPDIFGPPGSGSISTRYGSGSGSGYGSFSYQAKIIRKTFILLFCNFFMAFYLKNDVNVASKTRRKKLGKKLIFSCHLEGH